MNAPAFRPWWLRKRILFPLALLAGGLVAGLVAFVSTDASTIVIYNETGQALPPLFVRVCGQTRTFATLADGESVRVQLTPEGVASVIHLELGTEPPWQWDGDLIKPDGGYRVTIRLWPGNQVEAYTDISWLRRVLGGS